MFQWFSMIFNVCFTCTRWHVKVSGSFMFSWNYWMMMGMSYEQNTMGKGPNLSPWEQAYEPIIMMLGILTNDIQWQCWGNFCINTYQHQWFFHKQWRQYASMVDRGAKVQLWSRHRCQQLLWQNIWLCLVAMSPWDTGDLAFKAGRSGSCFKRSQKGRHVQIHITHINAS